MFLTQLLKLQGFIHEPVIGLLKTSPNHLKFGPFGHLLLKIARNLTTQYYLLQ